MTTPFVLFVVVYQYVEKREREKGFVSTGKREEIEFKSLLFALVFRVSLLRTKRVSRWMQKKALRNNTNNTNETLETTSFDACIT